ncbi:hypothetical protein HHI36_001258 [Cryptolaemus montrouzieri]|uniref:Retrotransposon gag domain-containing protein n=1 Tax=Cryptolaemus montrouzieri TaxID=559131 RepID=A0ABD2P7B9_9CUCU
MELRKINQKIDDEKLSVEEVTVTRLYSCAPHPHYYVDHELELKYETTHRLHHKDEPVMSYVTDLQMLIRQHGGFDERKEHETFHHNLLPEYRQLLWKHNLINITSILESIKTIEEL